LRLNPRGNRALQLNGIGIAYLLSKRFEEASETFLSAIEELPSLWDAYRSLAVCYAHMGRLREASEVIERVRAMNPRCLTRRTLPFRNSEHRELYLWGLRLALGEEAP
jgi:tetratricopeptide (TPR) repeat protein